MLDQVLETAAKGASEDRLIRAVRKARYRARTDLIWLARNVLAMPDVSRDIHGPMVSTLQTFDLPSFELCEQYDVRLPNGRWKYTPPIPMLSLPGKRRRLLLDFRGSLKTSLNVIAHTVQWIINYPDAAILIVHTSSEKAEIVVNRIREIFQYNPVFRALFPELVPQRKVADFGNRAGFTVPARSTACTHTEPTVMAGGMNKSLSGLHFDVIKFTDVVDEETIRGAGLQETIDSFYLKQNLLVSPLYWIDVEGTRYHYSDLYGRIVDEWKSGHRDFWSVYVRSVFRRVRHTFTPDDLDAPLLLDEKGRRVSWWPERYPLELLEEMERTDPYMFSCQMMNNPALSEGQAVFPVSDQYPKWITRADFITNVRVVRRVVSIDLAETTGERSNYTAASVGAWDIHGRVYIEHVIIGRLTADEAVQMIFALNERYRPDEIRIEETGYLRGLMASINRQMQLRGITLPLVFLRRDTRVAKVERIHRTLQPWYVRGDLVFLDDLGDPGSPGSAKNAEVKHHLLNELSRFPLYSEDDILDTLADMFQDRQNFGRLGEDEKLSAEIALKRAWNRMLGFIRDEYDSGGAPPYSRAR